MVNKLEVDAREIKSTLPMHSQIVWKNNDASHFIEEEIKSIYYIEAVNETFPILNKAWKFPDCI